MDTITLQSDSLFSKFGFCDGDILDDWWYWRFALASDGPQLAPEHELQDHGFAHALLIRLVEHHLLPALPRVIETYRISSIHNPIRAEDDEAQDFYVEVELTYEQVNEAATALLLENA